MSVAYDAARVAAESAEVADEFDAAFYAAANPAVATKTPDLLKHYCAYGWRELRKPNRQFDVWWYWANYLDPAVEDLNPLVHFVRSGRSRGSLGRPAPSLREPGAMLPSRRPVRRACLFAGFDAEGRVDDAVLLYLRELSRFADVYCLFDNYLPAAELTKLESVAKQAWAIRHGAYDFGSYSMLARDLVGWDQLAGYDEVLLVNDSCYLLRPLDDVFARMDDQPCDWWGLQATKGTPGSRDPSSHFTEPIPLDVVRGELLPTYEDDEAYDFHLGSYFLAFRRPVLDDEVFRRVLSSVARQRTKRAIIQKYEIGITHLLIGRGYAFSTYVEDLYPFHPIYSPSAFELIRRGFPLLKRHLLFQNLYDVPGLSKWKERVLAVVPDAPVEVFDQNLRRVAPADSMQRSFSIESRPDGSVDVPEILLGTKLLEADLSTPKRPDWWAFAVDPVTHLLPENSRAIFDHVAQDPAITKIVLTRSRRIELAGRNVVSHPVLSPEGRRHMMEAAVLFVSHPPQAALSGQLSPQVHHIISVRHGIMLTKHGRTRVVPEHRRGKPPPATGRLKMLHKGASSSLTAVLTGSDVDQSSEVAAQWPARHAHAWRTGIPAHDHLITATLPPDLADQEAQLRTMVAGRRLVVFAPVDRGIDTGWEPYGFSDRQVDDLVTMLRDRNAVLGIREPLTDLLRPYSAAFDESALDLSLHRFPATAPVLRVADVLVTDYDGMAVDFTLTGKPVVGFAFDLHRAADLLLFDYHHMFPGRVTADIDAFADALRLALDDPDGAVDRQYRRVSDLFIEHRDGRSAGRVVEHVRTLLGG